MKLHSDSKPMGVQNPETKKEGFEVDREKVSRILEAAKAKGRYTLGLESFDVLKAYGIPMVETGISETLEGALETAEKIGYPLV